MICLLKFVDNRKKNLVLFFYLQRIRMWRKNDRKFTELEIKVDDKKLCVNCGHYGRVQSHTKTGCAQCRMSHGCDASIWK